MSGAGGGSWRRSLGRAGRALSARPGILEEKARRVWQRGQDRGLSSCRRTGRLSKAAGSGLERDARDEGGKRAAGLKAPLGLGGSPCPRWPRAGLRAGLVGNRGAARTQWCLPAASLLSWVLAPGGSGGSHVPFCFQEEAFQDEPRQGWPDSASKNT